MTVGIVAPDRFILATRHTGYRGTVAAIAELVDNSLQAQARRIHIRLDEHFDRVQRQRSIDVGILDDGNGMTRRELAQSLQFGGTARFDDRRGLGRFGMGLPNSSVSQSRRIDVYSWRKPGQTLRCHLDVDDIATKRTVALPEPERARLPDWAQALGASSGTLVTWRRCDRLECRKGRTLAARLLSALGRIYRHALWDGQEIYVNEQPVLPVDPLHLAPDGRGGGRQYGPELRYELVSESGKSGVVTVRFVELPVDLWANLPTAEKRERGIVGGAGMSVLRAGREIDYAWKLFGAKRRENYDDWWRCELSFDPTLDEDFGVTHSKQGITPTPRLREALAPDLEAIARLLNSRVRAQFNARKPGLRTEAERTASSKDAFLPMAGALGRLHRGRLGMAYRLRTGQLDDGVFFKAEYQHDHIHVTLNTEHPFFEHIYQPAQRAHREGLELMLLSAARAGLSAKLPDAERLFASFLSDWSDSLHTFLE